MILTSYWAVGDVPIQPSKSSQFCGSHFISVFSLAIWHHHTPLSPAHGASHTHSHTDTHVCIRYANIYLNWLEGCDDKLGGLSCETTQCYCKIYVVKIVSKIVEMKYDCNVICSRSLTSRQNWVRLKQSG